MQWTSDETVGERATREEPGRLVRGQQARRRDFVAAAITSAQPEVWVRSSHAAAQRGTISLDELAGMEVIHAPRRAHAGTYDAWSTAVRAADPRFVFTDPPFQRSLLLTLSFAATADRPTAVLTGPPAVTGSSAWPIRQSRPAGTCGIVRVSLQNHPLTASAALAWSGDLPRPLQQLLFETADSLTAPLPCGPPNWPRWLLPNPSCVGVSISNGGEPLI